MGRHSLLAGGIAAPALEFECRGPTLDLGVVTGRQAGELDTAAVELLEEIKEAEEAAIVEAEEENK